jgi:hypothetical protein
VGSDQVDYFVFGILWLIGEQNCSTATSEQSIRQQHRFVIPVVDQRVSDDFGIY